MSDNYKFRNWLHLFGMGLMFGAVFCMQCMETGLGANGENLYFPGTELFYPKEKQEAALLGMGVQAFKAFGSTLVFAGLLFIKGKVDV